MSAEGVASQAALGSGGDEQRGERRDEQRVEWLDEQWGSVGMNAGRAGHEVLAG